MRTPLQARSAHSPTVALAWAATLVALPLADIVPTAPPWLLAARLGLLGALLLLS